jgi:membrane protease YdiL (CAAX protease family)
MALCWLRNRTGSVLPGVGIHGSWNTLASFANGGGVYAGICAALFAASLAAVVTRVREA